MVTIFWLAISYLLGAMPFGLLISKTCCGIDPVNRAAEISAPPMSVASAEPNSGP
jgi:acyl-phosphate glycerol-3-phosphate acyltransferase